MKGSPVFNKTFARVALLAALTVSTAACIQLPTSEASVVDLRPGISFKSTQAGAANVLVDGQVVGLVSDFITGQSVLRVLPGSHQIKVMRGSTVLLDEKVYLGDGVNRSFSVN